jgi:hypothetical protein
MENALPSSVVHAHPAHEPHHHGHHHHGGPSHAHGHGDHDHAHSHGHNHGHEARDARPAEAGFSLLALSSLQRLALAAPPVALLWLLTLWALNNG